MLTYHNQRAMLIERIAACQVRASNALREALQHVSVGDLNQGQADIRCAEADVERALLWKRTMEGAIDKHAKESSPLHTRIS